MAINLDPILPKENTELKASPTRVASVTPAFTIEFVSILKTPEVI